MDFTENWCHRKPKIKITFCGNCHKQLIPVVKGRRSQLSSRMRQYVRMMSNNPGVKMTNSQNGDQKMFHYSALLLHISAAASCTCKFVARYLRFSLFDDFCEGAFIIGA